MTDIVAYFMSVCHSSDTVHIDRCFLRCLKAADTVQTKLSPSQFVNLVILTVLKQQLSERLSELTEVRGQKSVLLADASVVDQFYPVHILTTCLFSQDPIQYYFAAIAQSV